MTLPRLGLGTWPMDDREAESVVAQAISLGYRLIDTAENYGNEAGVGRGMRASGVAREEVLVTSKFNKRWHGVDLVGEAISSSAERLGVSYLDLMLIHWPNPRQDKYTEAWKGLIAAQKAGLVRSIGTSNFKPAHLQRLFDETGVWPEVNQIELNPYVTRAQSRAFHEQHGIITESWAPLGGSGNGVLRDPVVTEIAQRYGKTPGQVVLRWHVEVSAVPIPKTSDPQRLKENLDLFGFSLDQADVAAISALDRGEARATDSDRFGH